MYCKIHTTIAAVVLSAVSAQAEFLFYEEAPIRYSDTESRDPLSKLAADLAAGRLVFDSSSEKNFLRDFLRHLKIPIESQVLVFSRTSFQNDRIEPQRPRAIYFSPEYYVGWVQGGDIEIIGMDPNMGPIFYRMNTPFGRYPEPRLIRDAQCLNCHGSSRTEGYPGMLVRSVYPDEIGAPIFGAGTHRTDHSSPISDRWGGWYVTGESAGARHMGNLYFEEGKPGEALPTKDFGAAPQSLEKAFDTSKYLAATSDIVGLMVLEHQVMAHNALAKAHLDTRRWLYIDSSIGKDTGRAEGEIGESTKALIERGADDLLRVMLLTDEIKLEGWGVEGGEAFQEAFAADAKTDSEGDSLRDLQLLSRLFKNRLSYMIHSKSFDSLHPVMKEAFYKKLWTALHGEGDAEICGHLGDKELARILTIVKATKKDLPGYWSME